MVSEVQNRSAHTIYHRGVKNAGSINMKLEAMALGNFPNLVSVFYRQAFPTATAETSRNIPIIR